MDMDARETELRIAAKLGELDWGRIASKMVQVYTGTKHVEVNA